MLIELTLDTQNGADREALNALVKALTGTQPTESAIQPKKTVLVTDNGAFDVPPVPIEQAIDEAKAATTPKETKAVSVSDATQAIQAAQGRGIGIDKVKELLATFEVKRVTELGDEKRAEFVAALAALVLED